MGKKQSRRVFSSEYKADAVKLWRESGESKEEIAKRLSIHGTTLAQWIKQDDIDNGDADGTKTADAEEIKRLRQENKLLQMERDLMKKAAAFFAKDGETR
jgi:transposase